MAKNSSSLFKISNYQVKASQKRERKKHKYISSPPCLTFGQVQFIVQYSPKTNHERKATFQKTISLSRDAKLSTFIMSVNLEIHETHPIRPKTVIQKKIPKQRKKILAPLIFQLFYHFYSSIISCRHHQKETHPFSPLNIKTEI